MKIKEIVERLAHQDQDRYVVLRDAHSGLVHSLQFLIEETAAIDGHQDFRCGPHNMDHDDPDKNTRVLHFGQQGWYGDYPVTPNVETVQNLLTELRSRNPEMPAVLTHHFDDMSDVDLIVPMEDMAKPVLWGNPGSNVRASPYDCPKGPPDRLLLIANHESEAYSHLRRTMDRELKSRVLELQSRRPEYRDLDQLPVRSSSCSRKALQTDLYAATVALREAEMAYVRSLQIEE